MAKEFMIKIDNVVKQYKLGEIGGTTLRDELQRLGARIHHQEDPTKKIGAKDYNKGEIFRALDGVSFEVKKGERVGIIGHNGAGKSTLLKLISRVTTPTEGSIGLNGRITSMLEVGTGFHGELTGRENIYMNGAILGMTKKEIDAKMEDIIEFSECRQFIDTPVKRYSSGMYVKLAFSVAAHLDSEIMIMDEVLAVGDMAFQKKCLDKMNDVSREQGRTILYVSHNMNTIRQLCDRVIVLAHGKVVFDGGVEEGISIYLENKGDISFPIAYDFRNVKRVWNFGQDLFLQSFEVEKVEKAIYKKGEDIHCVAHVQSNITQDGVQIIIRIKDRNQIMKYAGCLTEPFSVTENMEQIIRFDMPTVMLAPDTYSLSIEIVQFNGNGNYYPYDNPGMNMPVQIAENENNPTNWSVQYWGNVMLPQISVTVENS